MGRPPRTFTHAGSHSHGEDRKGINIVCIQLMYFDSLLATPCFLHRISKAVDDLIDVTP